MGQMRVAGAGVAAANGEDGGAAAGGSRVAVAAAIGGGLVALALGAGWIEREPIVAHFVDRSLAARHVPARYAIAAIGPFAQRLENVSIGDPGAPDLVAREVEVGLGYGLSGPYVTRVRAAGVRLSARLAGGRVSVGLLDRLLPAPSGRQPLALPAIDITLDDARLMLATPVGAVAVTVNGSGVLADGFAGRVCATSERLTAGGCTLGRARADWRVRVRDGRPRIVGPLALARVDCGGVAAGAGRAGLDLAFGRALDNWHGGVVLDGFAGRSGTARFGALDGRVTLDGTARRSEGRAALALAGVAAPAGRARRAAIAGQWRYATGTAGLLFAGDVTLHRAAMARATQRRVVDAAATLGATPLAPVATRAGGAFAALLADADVRATIAATALGRSGAALKVRRLDLIGRSGGRVRVEEGAGFGWAARDRGWRADGRVATAGGGLPEITADLRQAAAGAPIDGTVRMAPYAAPGGRLALAPVRLRVGDGTTRFATRATIDGPLADGRVAALALPLEGWFGAGRLVLGEGCAPVSFRSVAVAGTTLAPGRFAACGVDRAPILVVGAGGVRGGVETRGLRLAGRSGSAPLALTAARLRVGADGVVAQEIAVRLGAGEAVTRLEIGRLAGAFAGGPSGTFAQTGGRIARVPLILTNAVGRWRVAGGVLRLAGAMTVSDAAADPRFRPLAARDVTLSLVDGTIAATGTLAEPVTARRIADVSLRHTLADGRGGAVLTVPGIAFDRALQPEMLTPLTLGVIANVRGAIAGGGRIDWSPAGVTSSGTFATDRIDLAAAFGPVTGIAGRIRFSDLLGLVTPAGQVATVAEVNPGIAATGGVVRYRLLPGQRIGVEGARWPFAGGTLTLAPTVLDFARTAERRLTFRLDALDAAAFVQQLDLPNLNATGTFDGVLPMIFDQGGGRVAGGSIVARSPPGGTIAYVGELDRKRVGTMGAIAFDALKAIRYDTLSIALDGRLDGEMVSRVSFVGVRQATGGGGIVARLIRGLPFRFNIAVRAPFRGLLGTARSYADPSLLLPQVRTGEAIPVQPVSIQPSASEPVR